MCGGGALYSDAEKSELENECYCEISAFLDARRKLDESCAIILEKMRLHTSRDQANNWEKVISEAINSSKTMTVGEFETAVSNVRSYSLLNVEQAPPDALLESNEHNLLVPGTNVRFLNEHDSSFPDSVTPETLPYDLDEPMTPPPSASINENELPLISTLEDLSNVV